MIKSDKISFKSLKYRWGNMEKIILKAFAKINLALDVLGKRNDGYHEVEMIMQGINLYDLVELEKTEEGISLTCSIAELETDSRNLAYRAAALLINSFELAGGIKIHLHKTIPIAAGLAGGSTDAAAVILGMNELFEIGLTLPHMQKLAAQLGSDVPFCLNPVTSLAFGRGEIVKEIFPCPELWLVLVKPNFGVSTKEVYGHLQNITIDVKPDLQEIMQALGKKQLPELIDATGNVLEYATFDLYPQLKEFRREIILAGAKKVMMSGSGPTLIGFVSNETEAKRIASKLDRPEQKAFACRTLKREDISARVIKIV